MLKKGGKGGNPRDVEWRLATRSSLEQTFICLERNWIELRRAFPRQNDATRRVDLALVRRQESQDTL